MARSGYVAVSMDYRNGWNPLGTSVENVAAPCSTPSIALFMT
jgi:hypothetical protein